MKKWLAWMFIYLTVGFVFQENIYYPGQIFLGFIYMKYASPDTPVAAAFKPGHHKADVYITVSVKNVLSHAETNTVFIIRKCRIN
jgi:hypothetical protein